MANFLPRLLGAGIYKSKKRFKNAVVITDKRVVKCYEIELFCEDGGQVITNDTVYNVKKGNVLVSCPGDIRNCTLHFSCKYVHFEVFDEETKAMLAALPPFIYQNVWEELSDFFDATYNYFLSGREFQKIYTVKAIYDLICKIKSLENNMIKSAINSDKENPIFLAVNYIERNYNQSLTSNSIAEYCGLSVSHMHKKFLEVTGETPIGYLNRTRISHAKKMLLTDDKPLNIIATSCGFATQTYFNYCFKMSEGIPPAKYRKTAAYLPHKKQKDR